MTGAYLILMRNQFSFTMILSVWWMGSKDKFGKTFYSTCLIFDSYFLHQGCPYSFVQFMHIQLCQQRKI